MWYTVFKNETRKEYRRVIISENDFFFVIKINNSNNLRKNVGLQKKMIGL